MNLDKLKTISPQWWGAVAGATAAGAAVFSGHRVLGGLALGAAMLALALRTAPCCAGCAGGTDAHAPSVTSLTDRASSAAAAPASCGEDPVFS